MKKLTTAVLTLSMAWAPMIFGDEVIRLSEPVEVTADYEVFGARIGELGEVHRLSDIIGDADQFDGKQVFVEASVAKVCRKKGCFFIAQDGGSRARVTFLDYGFFVPTDSGGKAVTIVGTFSRTTLSDKKARHYAEDEGADPAKISGPQAEYGIVATSVIIPKS